MKQYYVVMFSGGIDSTYCIYKLLKEGYKVEAHFINLHQKDKKRYKEEYKAVNNILNWFKNNMDEVPITTSSVEFNEVIEDLPTVGYVAIHAFFDHKRKIGRSGVKDFKLDVCYGSERDQYRYSRDNETVMTSIFNSYFDIDRDDVHIKPKLFSPIDSIWKADIIKELPPDLLKLTWSCRFPHLDGSECKTCMPCKRNVRQKNGEKIDE